MKSRLTRGLLIAVMAAVLLTGCSSNGGQEGTGTPGVTINHEMSETLKTVSGTAFDLDKEFGQSIDSVITNQVYDLGSGYGVYFSEEFMNEIRDKMVGFMNMPNQGVAALYYDFDMASMEGGGVFEPSEEDLIEIFKFMREEKGKTSAYDEKVYDKHLIYEDEKFEYNYYVLKDENARPMSDEAKAAIKGVLAYREELKANAIIFPAQEIDTNSNGNGADELLGESSPAETENNFGTFSSQTVDGEAITEEIFADYDLTMVNLWATWCKPCVEEMSEFETLYKQLPDNVNLITIGHDADTESDLTKQILESKGATFDTVVANDEMRNTLLKAYMTFPTTIFVDREGNIVGDLMLGAPAANVVETYMTEINNRLEKLGK